MRKTSRVIINIYDHIKEDEAVAKVEGVIENGKISDEGNSYCYATRFGDRMVVTRKPNANNTYTFYVYRERQNRV